MRGHTRLAAAALLGVGAGFVGGFSVASTRKTVRTVEASRVGPVYKRPSEVEAGKSRTRAVQRPDARRPRGRGRGNERPGHARQTWITAFSLHGDGGRNLGTLIFKRPRTVRWTTTGGRFEIRFGRGEVAVRSRAKNGEFLVPAGIYAAVEVRSSGHWTLRTVHKPAGDRVPPASAPAPSIRPAAPG